MKKDVTTLGGLIAAFGLVLMAIFDVGSEFSKGITYWENFCIWQ